MPVAAKPHLCATDSAYWDKLSVASRHTLELQGAPMTMAEVAEFRHYVPLLQRVVDRHLMA